MTKIEPLVTWTTRDAAFVLGGNGAWLALARRQSGRNYLAPGQPAPILQVRVAGKLHAPEMARWDAKARRLTLGFGATGVSATLTVQAKPTHLVFELVEVVPKDTVELVVWGPYPTVISETIGEIVGVVRDSDTAIGIQALNVKTLGGFPGQESDIEPDFTADDTGTYPDLPDALKKDQLFRGDTARRTAFGSVVQGYCRNRSQERVIPNWGIEKFPAPAFDDGGVIGSKLALFLCPAAKALDTIGAIEVAEGLPHPLLDGVWAKKSPRATDSYLIVDFSESTIDRAIEMTL